MNKIDLQIFRLKGIAEKCLDDKPATKKVILDIIEKLKEIREEVAFIEKQIRMTK